jgi:curli production assembly/transport component CsgG
MSIHPPVPLRIALLLMAIAIAAATGCSTLFQPLRSSKAEIDYKSQVIDQLMALPPPSEKIVIAVYKFRDQTGQYKQSSASSLNYSTAVTQGATSMLIKSLADAGQGKWFTVVERESLPNLLNERKIIRQTRMQYLTREDLDKLPPLPPMMYAPVIMDGGVIAYETNLLTGGLGAKYLGIGADTQFQRDTVTIFLRAVAVKDGRVLKSVQTSKTIFSVKLDSSVFRFVAFKDLLEAEAGFSSNEPPQMAVEEAIQLGVYSMIMEGAMDGLWSFQSPALGQQLINSYQEDKNVKPVPIYTADGELEGFRKPPPNTAPGGQPPSPPPSRGPAPALAPNPSPAPPLAPSPVPRPGAGTPAFKSNN